MESVFHVRFSDALLILVSKFKNVDVEDGQGRSALYLASYRGIFYKGIIN